MKEMYNFCKSCKFLLLQNSTNTKSYANFFSIYFFSFGKLFPMNMVSVPMETMKALLIFNWRESMFTITKHQVENTFQGRVSVQGVKSLGSHFACLCRVFEFHEVIFFFCYYFSKRKWKYFYTFNHFYSEKSSKRAK